MSNYFQIGRIVFDKDFFQSFFLLIAMTTRRLYMEWIEREKGTETDEFC